MVSRRRDRTMLSRMVVLSASLIRFSLVRLEANSRAAEMIRRRQTKGRKTHCNCLIDRRLKATYMTRKNKETKRTSSAIATDSLGCIVIFAQIRFAFQQQTRKLIGSPEKVKRTEWTRWKAWRTRIQSKYYTWHVSAGYSSALGYHSHIK